jgi:hypothetical protein
VLTEGGVLLRAVASPTVLLGAAPDLTKVSGGVAVMTYLLTLNGFYAAIAFALAHLLALWLTVRDPDFVEVARAWARVRRQRGLSFVCVPAFYPVRGNRYVP